MGLLDLISILTQLEIDQPSYQQETANEIAFANAKTKSYYDSSHKLFCLSENDIIFLQLHQEYNLANKPDKTLFN